MDYKKGYNDGKESQNIITWILFGFFLSVFGWVFIFALDSKPRLTKQNFDYVDNIDYTRGYKKGVSEKRWTYYLLGLLIVITIRVLAEFLN